MTEARPDAIEQSFDFYTSILWADGGAWAKRILEKNRTSETLLQQRIAQFKAIQVSDYTALIERWDLFKSRMLKFWRDFDVLIFPLMLIPRFRMEQRTRAVI